MWTLKPRLFSTVHPSNQIKYKVSIQSKVIPSPKEFPSETQTNKNKLPTLKQTLLLLIVVNKYGERDQDIPQVESCIPALCPRSTHDTVGTHRLK